MKFKRKLLVVALFAIFPISIASAIEEDEPDPVASFEGAIQKAKDAFRVARAASIREADRVVLHIVDFDGVTESMINPFGDQDKAPAISVAPYKSETAILKTRELEPEEQRLLIGVLAKEVANPEHGGGAFCHYPIHGVRIFRGDALLHEGTFCWVCGNFGFTYPNGVLSGWIRLRK